MSIAARVIEFGRRLFSAARSALSIRHYPAARDENSPGELVVLKIASKHVPERPAATQADEDGIRPVQRNSAKQSNAYAAALNRASHDWLRAWKFCRFDADMRAWPALDVGAYLAPEFERRSLFTRGWEKILDDGIRYAVAIPNESTYWRSDSESELSKFGAFFYVRSIRLAAACREGARVVTNARWHILLRGVAFPEKGRPHPFRTVCNIAENGRVLEGTGDGRPAFVGETHDFDSLSRVAIHAAWLARRRAIDWDLLLSRGTARFMLPVDRVAAREILFNREKDGERRRAAALHWVKAHTRADGSYVPAHLRGKTEFRWKGWDARLAPASLDELHQSLGTVPTFDREAFHRELLQKFPDTMDWVENWIEDEEQRRAQ